MKDIVLVLKISRSRRSEVLANCRLNSPALKAFVYFVKLILYLVFYVSIYITTASFNSSLEVFDINLSFGLSYVL